MKNWNKLLLRSLILACSSSFLFSCNDDDQNTTIEDDDTSNGEFVAETRYFVGIEGGADAPGYTLSSASTLESGTISPIDNGFTQAGWANYFQGEDEIFSIVGTTLNSYRMSGEELEEGETIFTELGLFSFDLVDSSRIVAISSPWYNTGSKTIYIIDTDNLSIYDSVETTLNDNVTVIETDTNITYEGLTFPSGVKVVGDNLFVSYYTYNASLSKENESDVSGTTPDSNEAKIAVFSYPDLEFIKVITDERIPNIGRYASQHGMAADENGDLYVTASSSLACGYYPTPTTNSGILKINNGETEFDTEYHIDFETLSGGYKINDIYYVGEGKAVVRILQEDETIADYFWAAYAPGSEFPLLNYGIIDLYNETFELVSGAPNDGGGWGAPVLVEDNIVYVGISNSTYSGIYAIDTDTATATEAADVDGTYAQGILSLSTTEE